MAGNYYSATGSAHYVNAGDNTAQALANYDELEFGPGQHQDIVITGSMTNKTLIGVPNGGTRASIEIQAGASYINIRGFQHNPQAIRIGGQNRSIRTHHIKIEYSEWDIFLDNAWLDDCEFICNSYCQIFARNIKANRVTFMNPTGHGAGFATPNQPAIDISGFTTAQLQQVLIVANNELDPFWGSIRLNQASRFDLVGFDEEGSHSGGESIRITNCPNFNLWAVQGRPQNRNGVVLDNAQGRIMLDTQSMEPGSQNIIMSNGATVQMIRMDGSVQGNTGLPNYQALPAGASLIPNIDPPVERSITQKVPGSYSGADDSATLQSLVNNASAGTTIILARPYLLYSTVHMKRGVHLRAVPGVGMLVGKTNGMTLIDTNFGASSDFYNLFDVIFVGNATMTAIKCGESGVQLTKGIWGGVQLHGFGVGILVDGTYAVDNFAMCYSDFIGCVDTIKQTTAPGSGDYPEMNYIDKWNFNDVGFHNCTRGLDLQPNRGDYLNSFWRCGWYDCAGGPRSGGNTVSLVYCGCRFRGNGLPTINATSSTTVSAGNWGVDSVHANMLANADVPPPIDPGGGGGGGGGTGTATLVQNSGILNSGTNTLSYTFPTKPIVGNKLILHASCWNNATPPTSAIAAGSVVYSDNAPVQNTATVRNSASGGETTVFELELDVTSVPAGGSTFTVTITLPRACDSSYNWYEWNGLAGYDSAGADADNYPVPTTMTPSGALAQANEMQMSAIGGNGGSSMSFTAPSGFTIGAQVNNNTYINHASDYRLASSTTPGSSAWGSNVPLEGNILTAYKVADASGAAVTVALGGLDIAVGQGAFAASVDKPLSGQQAAAAQGAFVPALGLTLGGYGIASAQGSLAPQVGADVTLGLIGLSIATQAGDLTPSQSGGNVTIALTGFGIGITLGELLGPGNSTPIVKYSEGGHGRPGRKHFRDNKPLMQRRFDSKDKRDEKAAPKPKGAVNEAIAQIVDGKFTNDDLRALAKEWATGKSLSASETKLEFLSALAAKIQAQDLTAEARKGLAKHTASSDYAAILALLLA